jgi:RNA polymerase sigma factor (TIGR02999 family)
MDASEAAASPPPGALTALLRAWSAGDLQARERLLPLVYEDLRRRAVRYLRRERRGHTLEPAALVNEAYLRLVDQRRVEWRDRSHFFGLACQMMRRVLVDHARARKSAKRGGGQQAVLLEDALVWCDARGLDVLALDRALAELERLDPEQGQLVELRFFGGLSAEDTAAVLGVSLTTFKRRWRLARAWLHQRLA